MTLVSLEQVDRAIRLDLQGDAPDFADDERTPDVALKIAQAEDIILDYVNPKPDPAWTPETVPARVTAAIIIAVRCLLDESDENTAILSGLAGGNPGPKNTIAALLWRLRQPVMS